MMGRGEGFTFIEAILAMLIIGIGCTGLMTAFTVVNWQSGNTQMTVTAALLAQEQMERIVADKLYRGYQFIVPNNYPSPQVLPVPFERYSRTIVIREVAPGDLRTNQGGSGLKRVDITMQWGAAATQQVQLSTLVSSYL